MRKVELPLAKGRRKDSKVSFFNGKEGRVDFRNNTIMMNNFKDIKVAVTSTGTVPVWML